MSRHVWLRTVALLAVAAAAASCSRSSNTSANVAAGSLPPPPAAAPAPAPAAAQAAAIPEVITTPASMPAPGAAGDCPFVGPLQNFTAHGGPVVRTYDSYDFKDVEGGKPTTVTKTGQFCEQIYWLKPGTPALSGLEIMSNYEQSLPAAGATITNPGRSGGDDIYARAVKGGATYWLQVSQNGDSITVHEIGLVPFQRTLTAPSGDDFHLLGHLPQTTPRAPVKTNYDEVSFDVANGAGTKPVKVRGYHYKMIYDLPSDRHISGLESQLNYRAALKDLGAQILYADPSGEPGETTARINDGGKTVWISVVSNAAVTVDTLEEKPFQMTVKPPQASDMKTALDRDGRVTLYINFDFNKATLKPDAAPIVAQIVALLKANPTLKLSVDGYTDGVGLHDYNVKLSQARAAAVVAALEAQSIGADRLASAGYGPDKPIASNDTDDGRAKNRRVELVKM
jgi:outer membrane protein OmpA-like peptidoglycan-associated protein